MKTSRFFKFPRPDIPYRHSNIQQQPALITTQKPHSRHQHDDRHSSMINTVNTCNRHSTVTNQNLGRLERMPLLLATLGFVKPAGHPGIPLAQRSFEAAIRAARASCCSPSHSGVAISAKSCKPSSSTFSSTSGGTSGCLLPVCAFAVAAGAR